MSCFEEVSLVFSVIRSAKLSTGLIGAVVCMGVALGNPPRGTPLSFEDYTQALLAQNPEGQREGFLVEEAKFRLEGYPLLPDPEIRISKEELLSISLTQQIPWPNAYYNRQTALEAKLNETKTLTKIALELRKLQAAADFLGLIRKSDSLKIIEQELQNLTKIREFGEARLKQGLGQHADMLQIQIDIELTKSRVAGLRRDLENQKDTMRYRIGETSGEVDFKSEVPRYLFVDAKKDVYETNKNVGSADFASEKSNLRFEGVLASLQAQQAQLRPSFSLGASAMQKNDGMWMSGFMIGMSLPIFSATSQTSINQQIAINTRQQRTELSAIASEKHTALNVANRRILQAQENLTTLQQRIIPLAAEHLKLTSSEFVAGKSALIELLNAERNVLGLRISEIDARATLAIEQLARSAILSGINISIDNSEIPQLNLNTNAANGSMNSMASSANKSMNGAPGGMSRQKKKSRSTSPEDVAPDNSNDVAPAQQGTGGMKM
jgi:outer membrane protein TolC